MSNKKISELITALEGKNADVIPIVQDGVTKKIKLQDLKEISISPTAPTSNESVWIKKGKNKFNYKNAVYLNAYMNTENMILISSDSTMNHQITFVKCEPNTTYTVSKQAGATFRLGTMTNFPQIGGTINQTVVNHTGTELTITTGNNDSYLLIQAFSVQGGDTGTYLEMYKTVQVEQNSTATDYEPYIEKEIYVKNDNGVFERFYKDNGIIDSGSNDNFKYIKFSDGTLIQYATIIFNNPSWNQWGSLYYAEYDMSQYKFPVSFIDRPVVTGNISHGTGSGDGWISRIGGASTTDIESLAIARPTTYADSIYVNITAIGRWK